MTEFGVFEQIFADTLLKRAQVEDEEIALSLKKLMHDARAGHLCIHKKQLGLAIEKLPSSIAQKGNALFPRVPVLFDQDHYYLQKNWVYETYILQHLSRLRSQLPPSYFDREIFERNLSQLSGELFPAQRRAIRSVLQSSFSLICGGPGTGKTYTAAHLVNLLFSSLDREKKKDFYICLAALTGKAALHLQHVLSAYGNSNPALHIETSTLHRLLKLSPNDHRLFSEEKIDADLIIVDEASMIDVPLLAHLLEAVGEDSLLVLIGDPAQLPPVNGGSLFSEISALFSEQLEQCVRAENFYLQQLAHTVKQGDTDQFFQLCPLNEEMPQLEELIARMDPIVSFAQPDPKLCLEKYKSFGILNALRQGPQGADALNQQMFQTLQKHAKWWAVPIFAVANDTFSELYNGMSGVLIGQNVQEAVAYFLDPSLERIRSFSPPFPYELAFCLSVHKSQGSEFEEVLALFPMGSENFGREALYTALTRAKKNVEVRGQRKVLQEMIRSTSHIRSRLSARFAALSSEKKL